MKSTRERKEQFINSFGDRAALDAVKTMISRHGLIWLTDEQINDITSDMAYDVMATTKHTIRNRPIYRQSLEGKS